MISIYSLLLVLITTDISNSYLIIDRCYYPSNKVKIHKHIHILANTNNIDTSILDTNQSNKKLIAPQLALRLKEYLSIWQSQQNKEDEQLQVGITNTIGIMNSEDTNVLSMFQPGLYIISYMLIHRVINI